MHPMIETFKERPRSQKIILWILSLVLFAGIFWLNVYKANWQKLQDLTLKVEKLDTQVLEHQRKAKELPKFLEETARLDKQLERVVLQLPDKKEIQALLSSVSTLAVDTGLEVIKVSPQREVFRDFFAEVPMYLEVEGTFHQLATFFDEIAHLSRIVNITEVSVDILSENKTEVVIRGSCVVTAFRYLDESERVAAPAPAAEAGKKRRRPGA